MEITVFGDSHSFYLFGEVDVCTVHWLGPVTMHRVGRDGLNGLDVRKYGVNDGDIAVFVFGEIDVRIHVGKQRYEEGRDVEEILETLCTSYLSTIEANVRQFEKLHVIVCLVVPPSDQGENPEYPFYGMLSERVELTRRLNERLGVLSRQKNFHVLDVYSPYCREDGSLDHHFSDGIVHIHKDCKTINQALLMECVTQICQELKSEKQSGKSL